MIFKLVTIIGARPQFVKASAVSRALKSHLNLEEKILHTGQHFDSSMSNVFFSELEIPKPAYQLEVHSLPHGAMTGRMLEQIESVLQKEQPQLVLVYGDTNSTLAGALAASKLHIPLAHVEAGLRSFNMKMPEEVNRILTDRISTFLFCPTQNAIDNLKEEGFPFKDQEISNVGDVMVDTVRFFGNMAEEEPVIPYAVLTLHRQENTDNPDRLKSIVNAVNELSKEFKIKFPIHPRTRKALQNEGLRLSVEFIDPLGYRDMVSLVSGSKLVLTDSGGLQKEAYFLSKPCITLRDETEWIELVEEGANKVVGAETDRIVTTAKVDFGRKLYVNPSLYGDGKASERIVASIEKFLKA